MAEGEIFNREKIAHGLENLRILYGKKGYVNFSVVPQTTIDEASDTISLLMDLDAGSAFHLGKLTVLGEESVPGARNRLLKTWESYEGQIYDPALLSKFLRDLNARRSVRPEQVFETSQDYQARTINVQITLVKPYTMAFSNK
jgi:outer membrane translocation and assembly module TamA